MSTMWVGANAVTIVQAVAAIIGEALAVEIISDRGLHWAVVAAMCEATTDDDPEAIRVIRAWKDEQVYVTRQR
jgi:hypothetical protein